MGKKEEGYVPSSEFVEDNQEPLVDIQMNGNTELWLVQLPDDQFPDLGGQKLTLDLDQDGELGSVKGPDGTVYSLVNFPANVAETTVFQPTPSGTKYVGQISRHVSLVHYPEPKEPGTEVVAPKKRVPSSTKTTLTKTQFLSPARSGRSRQSGDSSRGHSSISSASGLSDQPHKKKSKTRT